jgi:hypothetical protein
MEKLFARGKLKDVEQIRRFLSRLQLEIKKLCVMRDYANMEALLNVALEMEWVLAELCETPFELLKEEQEKNMGTIKMVVEKQVQVLNESLINLLEDNQTFNSNQAPRPKDPQALMIAKYVMQRITWPMNV